MGFRKANFSTIGEPDMPGQHFEGKQSVVGALFPATVSKCSHAKHCKLLG